MNAFVSAAGSLLFWGVVLGFMVLSVRPRPGTDARTITEAAQKYARRIGIVALATAVWLPGVLQPVLQEAGGQLWWDGHYALSSALLELGAPTVFALAVLAVGEVTWPRPRGTVRTARLEHRGVRELIPGYMTGVACFFLGYNLLVLGTTVLRDPGSIHAQQLLAGWAPWILVTAAAVAGILKLISVRPAVPGTSPEADAALRQAAAHRVLRTAAFLMILLAWSGGIFLGNYPSPPGPGPLGDALRYLSLFLTFAGAAALLKRAPRVPLPESSASSATAAESSPLAVKSMASSLRLTIGGTLLAAAVGIGVFAPAWEYRIAAPLALAAAAGCFTLFCALTEYAHVRRIRKHSPGTEPLDPEALDFLRPPRWLSWTGTAAAALTLVVLLGSALLGPTVDQAARSYAEAAAGPRTTPGPPASDSVWVPDAFFDWRFALLTALLVLLLPLLTDLVSQKVLERPSLPADRDVDLRLRRVALFRLARTSTAACLASAGLVLFDMSLHSPWANVYNRDIPVDPPLTWLAPLVQQSNAVGSVLLLAAVLVAWRQFGPSHFPDDPRYAERADLPPARQA
ncbi:hypothetical protein [Arthrobacter sp. 7Tela_A1]|uniref:hypothetical protein n=1 Tax=Arthrobacter sp. 7Tela_A1 TaxID=3093745 RepID=UPI003BB711D2